MQAEIRTAITQALETLGIEPVDFVVEHPADLRHGDYATNVALVAAKQADQHPRELAETISASLTDFETSVAGPGFINIHLERNFFATAITQIHEAGGQWGCSDAFTGKTVLIEYTSPNLFKPLHIGNLVGNIIGESLTRLFMCAGADVKRINFPSDIGLTVAKGVWGLQETGGDPTNISALGEAYRVGNEAYERGGDEAEAIRAVNKALYAGDDPELERLRETGLTTSRERLRELCIMLGTQFDAEVPESEVGAPGQALVESHVGTVFTESDGAIVYPGEKVGLHTRVFLSSEHLPTYEAKDLGNFVRKQELFPDWSQSIIVTGNEQTEYFKVLYAAIRELFPETNDKGLEHVPTGFLTLTTGKMSSRKGNVLTGESLLAEMEVAARERAAKSRTDDLEMLTTQVAVAALKYQILKHSVGSNIVFDKERALSFEGDSGPYLQYTNARINSVLEKAVDSGVTPDTSSPPSEPYTLEKLIYRYPEVLQEALAERAPHKVVTFLTELAGEFNSFYGREQIADPADEYAPYKAAVTAAVGQTLQNGLWVLGIEAPERM